MTMKKVLCTILVLFVLAGCGASEQSKEPSQGDVLYEKYKTLIDALESKDFEGAVAEIQYLYLNQETEDIDTSKAGDINDYLLEVEIDENNIADYFEPIWFKKYNEFGEERTGSIGYGLKSKLYDEGYIVYKVNDDIQIELDRNGRKDIFSLEELLSCGVGIGGDGAGGDFTVNYSGRLTGGKVTFIKKEYVAKYDVEKPSNPADTYKQFTIVLNNGEVIYKVGNVDYLY